MNLGLVRRYLRDMRALSASGGVKAPHRRLGDGDLTDAADVEDEAGQVLDAHQAPVPDDAPVTLDADLLAEKLSRRVSVH